MLTLLANVVKAVALLFLAIVFVLAALVIRLIPLAILVIVIVLAVRFAMGL